MLVRVVGRSAGAGVGEPSFASASASASASAGKSPNRSSPRNKKKKKKTTTTLIPFPSSSSILALLSSFPSPPSSSSSSLVSSSADEEQWMHVHVYQQGGGGEDMEEEGIGHYYSGCNSDVDDDQIEGSRAGGEFWRRSVFGSTPSPTEVERAVSSLQQILPPETAQDWIEPTLHVSSATISQQYGFEKILNAFYLLQADTDVQRMVVSLASDTAVWKAIMKNEVVREFQESIRSGPKSLKSRSHRDPNVDVNILWWILEKMKSKIVDLVESVVDVLSNLFKSKEGIKYHRVLEETLNSSFMLTVIVLLVVMVARGYSN